MPHAPVGAKKEIKNILVYLFGDCCVDSHIIIPCRIHNRMHTIKMKVYKNLFKNILTIRSYSFLISFFGGFCFMLTLIQFLSITLMSSGESVSPQVS
jgi:hypothetical protein